MLATQMWRMRNNNLEIRKTVLFLLFFLAFKIKLYFHVSRYDAFATKIWNFLFYKFTPLMKNLV